MVTTAIAVYAVLEAKRRPFTEKSIDAHTQLLRTLHKVADSIPRDIPSSSPLFLPLQRYRDQSPWPDIKSKTKALISELERSEALAKPFLNADHRAQVDDILYTLRSFDERYEKARKAGIAMLDSKPAARIDAVASIDFERQSLLDEVYQNAKIDYDRFINDISPSGISSVERKIQSLRASFRFRPLQPRFNASFASRCLEISGSLFAVLAAALWFLSAYGELPPVISYYDQIPPADPFYAAITFSAKANRYAAALSGASALCFGFMFLLRVRLRVYLTGTSQ